MQDTAKSDEPASQSSEPESDDSQLSAEGDDQQVPSDIMSLVSVTMEVEEPQTKRRKTKQEPASAKPGCHECTFCDKTFRDRYHLARHMFVHAGEKIPDCKLCKTPRDVCGCGPYPPILEKPHKCDRCGKAFRDKYHLNRHVFVHTREKPFKCMFCDKHFSRKDKLMQHSLQHR